MCLLFLLLLSCLVVSIHWFVLFVLFAVVLSLLDVILQKLQVGNNGIAYLLETNGMLLSSSQRGLSTKVPRIYAPNAEDPYLKQVGMLLKEFKLIYDGTKLSS